MTNYPRYALLAACMMHVEGYFSTKSLSFRLRNPGNIESREGSIKLYPTIQAGFDALVADIAVNAGKTLSAFIAKYAPPNENNTGMYIQVVSTLSGIAPDELI